MMGAGEVEENIKIIKLCQFLGNFSYPLIISHCPVIYCHIGWDDFHENDQLFNKIVVSVGCFMILLFNTYALIKLYDEPIRKWLAEKYLTINKKENIKNVAVDEEKDIKGC